MVLPFVDLILRPVNLALVCAMLWPVFNFMTVFTSCTTVYGFFNDSVTQPEQGQGYMIRVGYMKGAASGGNLIFDVMDTPGTASEITTHCQLTCYLITFYTDFRGGSWI